MLHDVKITCLHEITVIRSTPSRGCYRKKQWFRCI